MKQFLLAISILSFITCQNEPDRSIRPYTILSGKIKNPVAENIYLTYLKESTSTKDTATLSSPGKFLIRLDLDEPKYLIFAHGREYATLFLRPGDSVHMTLNTAQFDESLKFSGKGADANNYLISSFLYAERENFDNRQIYELPTEMFIATSDSIKALKKDFLESYIEGHSNLAQKFIQSEEARIEYYWAGQRLAYPEAHKYFTGKAPEIDDSYDDYLEELRVSNPSMIHLDTYAHFLGRYLSHLSSNRLEEDSTLREKEHAFTRAGFQVIEEKFEDEEVREYLYYRAMKNQIKYYGIDNLDSMMLIFREKVENKEYRSTIEEIYEMWTHLARGSDAPGFTFPDINGKQFSLNDFKGQYVYIDVWATWCNPCKKELPYFESLVEDYGNDIKFVGISVDADPDDWKEAIKTGDMKGIQLYGGADASITEDYMIYSIPRFIFIDPEGKIYNARAPRPSETGPVKELLNRATLN